MFIQIRKPSFCLQEDTNQELIHTYEFVRNFDVNLETNGSLTVVYTTDFCIGQSTGSSVYNYSSDQNQILLE